MEDRHEGMQIKVWIPDGFYDLLRGRAKRFGTSVAEEARQLMQAGLAPLEAVEKMGQTIEELNQFLRLHVEPLAFIAAMDAAYGAESWRYQFGAAYKDQAAPLDRTLRERAAARLKRQLRELESDGGLGEGPVDGEG
jgi:plasmid stability protein